ncbi:MAG TPA: hypothetical protein VE988_20865, partial [Gemmataceae bacterium]|nr:hypothetical protein [Gemmataceae bacterium]
MLRCYPVLSLTLLSLTFVANASQPQPPARDLHGDPLPPGAVARLGMARWLQGTIADFAEFLPDGKTVVTVSDDRTVCLWEFPSGRELHRFSLPAGPAKVPDPKKMAERNYARAALSKDGKVIAVGYLHEPEIYLHETATGKKLPGLTSALTTGIDALAFSPSGDNLAAAEGDGAIRIWDWARAKEIRTLTVGVQPYNPGFDKLPLA